MFMFILSRSSHILSIHVFCCLPLLLVPSTYPCRAIDGNLSLPILITCPSHFSLVSVCPSSLLVTSFLILSLLVLPFILLSQLISVVKSLLSSSLLRHQHSESYSSTGMTKVSYNFNFVLVVMLLSFQILFSLPNIAHARVLLRSTL